MGLAKVVGILAARTIPVVSGLGVRNGGRSKYDVYTPLTEVQGFKISAFRSLERSMTEILENSTERSRKLEIAAALLANGVWKQRGHLDKHAEAPRRFWQVVPTTELCRGDKRTLKTWWVDALIRTAKDLRGAPIDNRPARPHSEDDYAMENLAEINLARNTHGIRARAALMKPIGAAIAAGFLPARPWERAGLGEARFRSASLRRLARTSSAAGMERIRESRCAGPR